MNKPLSRTLFPLISFASLLICLAPTVLVSQDTSSAEGTVKDFDTHPQLKVGLFASEPMLVNPTNIDVDHLGRVWVCEVVNYRNKIRNRESKIREQGDRILVLSDIDGDGKADQSKLFYQGRDVDSAHGICVLGNRVVVSAGSKVFYLIDDDGDLKADRKEVLFSNIMGSQHDHGIHACVFGPDGKLYFNFGNEGRQISDKFGKPIVDIAGNEVNDSRKPYQQGMVFRCNLDGSEFETLAWNFRNNWEVTVDSFGGIWQSDNDDDGNRGTRINHVLHFGNYGYRDEFTGAAWRQARSGQSQKIAERHWHQNDPGVIPNLLNTGAGSPTGICVYEADLFPKIFQNQLLHCDAGPNVVRAYVLAQDRSGYEASIVNILDGEKKNKWFRPSDVSVAPDGSVFVSDWFDPGVGGHRMRDVAGGRIYRITPRSSTEYRFEKPEFATIGSSINALKSPNLATRFLAFDALVRFGNDALPDLKAMTKHGNTVYRARAYWVADKIQSNLGILKSIMSEAWKSRIPDLQKMSLRWVRSEPDSTRAELFWEKIDWTAIPEGTVTTEAAICLSPKQRFHWTRVEHAQRWVALAKKYQPGDRWFLESLGIGAEGNWELCIEKLLSDQPDWQKNEGLREIVWRSRSTKTVELLVDLVKSEFVSTERIPRLFRAMDGNKIRNHVSCLTELAFANSLESDRDQLIALEAVERLDPTKLDSQYLEPLNKLVDRLQGTKHFVSLIAKFRLRNRYPELIEVITGESRQLAVDAIQALIDSRQLHLIVNALRITKGEKFENLIATIRSSGNGRLAGILIQFAGNRQLDLERRKAAVGALNRNRPGCQALRRWVESGDYDKRLDPAISAVLHNSPWAEFRKLGQVSFPIDGPKGGGSLNIIELVKLRGDAANGLKVFSSVGTCNKCHVVSGVGKQVGPDLSEIGSKLSREACFESILFPSAGISHNYENWMVQKDDGTVVTGLLICETEDEIQIRDGENILHKIPPKNVEERKQLQLSLMPEDLHKEMTKQELIDLVEYLLTLKKS